MANSKVVFITNIPAPYRELVHQHCYELLSSHYCVLYCSRIESNRSWNFNYGSYEKDFLTCKSLKISGRTIYLWSDILKKLRSTNPDVIIIGGFSIPMIISYLWALINKRKIISFTDANIQSESRLSFIHKSVRKVFYSLSKACIGASVKSLALYKSYGVKSDKLFQSHLCANNSIFNQKTKPFQNRDFDILLCGQMIPGKMFDFSLDVIEILYKNNSKLKVKLLGSGPDKEKIIDRLNSIGVYYEYPGFVDQSALPQHYLDCKLFLFPSVKDAWGVVANEACAAGTPVITCPVVGAADELIISDVNGFVLETSVELWAQKVEFLLDNPAIWQSMSENATKSVEIYTYENAAIGIFNAVNYVRCNQ